MGGDDDEARDAQAARGGVRPGSRWHTRGRVPHWEAGVVPQHIVLRLADSLPAGLRAELVRTLASLPRAEQQREERAAIEAALDRHHGACHLRIEAVARVVEAALLHFDGVRYALHAWSIMPSHVHVLATPGEGWTLSALVHGWKSYTAHAANRVLGRTGPFWAGEYYDRAIRNNVHYVTTVAYIEANPVRGGLCASPADHRFGSAYHRARAGDGGGG